MSNPTAKRESFIELPLQFNVTCIAVIKCPDCLEDMCWKADVGKGGDQVVLTEARKSGLKIKAPCTGVLVCYSMGNAPCRWPRTGGCVSKMALWHLALLAGWYLDALASNSVA